MPLDIGTFLSGLGGGAIGKALASPEVPSGLSAAPVEAPTAEAPATYDEARAAYLKKAANLERLQADLLKSLEYRAQGSPSDKFFALARGFAAPNPTGQFATAFGSAIGSYQDQQEKERAAQRELAQMRLALGQSQLAQNKEMMELARQGRIQELGKNLYTTATIKQPEPTGTFYGMDTSKGFPARDDEGNLLPGADVLPGKTVQRLNPEVLRQMMSVDPKGTMEYLQAQKTVQEITAPKTQKLGAEDTIFEQNEDGTWKVIMSGQGKVGIEEKIAMRQLGLDPANLGSLTAQQASKLQNQIRVNKAGIDTDINEAMTLLGIPLSRINDLTPTERNQVEAKILAKKTAAAPKTTVTVGAESEFGKAFGKAQAELLSGQLAAAMDAEKLVKSASEMRSLLAGGNVITGPLAGIALQANRFVGDPAKVRDTQLYLNQMSASTLAAIKGSGLGTGQGFTDKDRKFLEEAVGGNITWDASTLQKLADLNELAARGSINRWNESFKKMSPKVTEGLPTIGAVEQPAFNIPRDASRGNAFVLSTNPSLAEMQKASLPPDAIYLRVVNGQLKAFKKGAE